MGRRKKEFTGLTGVPLDRIKPPATRGVPTLTNDTIGEMAQALERGGQQEPVLLFRAGRANLRIVSGRRRFLAAQLLGWNEIQAVVLTEEMEREVQAIDRLQAGEVNPWELADALNALQQAMNWSQAQLGAVVDCSRDFVANFLVIREISPEARKGILTMEGVHRLTTRHLRYVARSAPKDQVRVAMQILADQMSTTRLEREHHDTAPKTPTFRLQGIREPIPEDSRNYPVTYRDWRKYQRRLTTDLRRIERQEQREMARARAAINEARVMQKQVKTIAGKQRKKLEKELRQARKRLDILGDR